MKNSVFCWSHPISDLLLSLFSCWHLDSSHVLFGMKFQQYPSFPGLVLVSNWLIILSLLTLHISRAGAGMNTNFWIPFFLQKNSNITSSLNILPSVLHIYHSKYNDRHNPYIPRELCGYLRTFLTLFMWQPPYPRLGSPWT